MTHDIETINTALFQRTAEDRRAISRAQYLLEHAPTLFTPKEIKALKITADSIKSNYGLLVLQTMLPDSNQQAHTGGIDQARKDIENRLATMRDDDPAKQERFVNTEHREFADAPFVTTDWMSVAAKFSDPHMTFMDRLKMKADEANKVGDARRIST